MQTTWKALSSVWYVMSIEKMLTIANLLVIIQILKASVIFY